MNQSLCAIFSAGRTEGTNAESLEYFSDYRSKLYATQVQSAIVLLKRHTEHAFQPSVSRFGFEFSPLDAATRVIILTLLHPDQQTPVQVWTFENESLIRIGRATDNHVILYSAVVSRHHAELRQIGTSWEIINLGANGTYLNGKRIDKVSVEDGAIIRLARSGPNIQIRLGDASLPNLPKSLGADRPLPSATSNSLSITDINHYNSAEPQNLALLHPIVS